MFRVLAGAVLVGVMTFGVASAETVKGKVTRISGDSLTITAKAAVKGQKGEAKSYDIAKDVKVYKMDKKTRLDVADGLKAAELQNLGKKGIQATLTVVDNKVTEITIGGKGKKKKVE